jgi:hypothetical protein
MVSLFVYLTLVAGRFNEISQWEHQAAFREEFSSHCAASMKVAPPKSRLIKVVDQYQAR